MVELIRELDAQTKENFKKFQASFDAFHKNNEEKGQNKFLCEISNCIISLLLNLKKSII